MDAVDSYETGDKMEGQDGISKDTMWFLVTLLCWTGELKSDKDALPSDLAMPLQRVHKGKRLCLFRRLFVDRCYPDFKAAD